MTMTSILAILLVGQAACSSIGYGQLPTSNVQPASSAYGAPAPSALPLAGHPHSSHQNPRQNIGQFTSGSPSASPFLYNNEMTNSFPSQQWNSGFVPHMFQPSNMNSQYGALYQLPSGNNQADYTGGYGTSVHNIGGHPYIMYRQPFLPSTQKAGADHSAGAYEYVPETNTSPTDSSVSVSGGYGYNQGNVYERLTTPAETQSTVSHKKTTITPLLSTSTTPSSILSSNDPWAAIAASNGLTKRQRFTI